MIFFIPAAANDFFRMCMVSLALDDRIFGYSSSQGSKKPESRGDYGLSLFRQSYGKCYLVYWRTNVMYILTPVYINDE